MADPHLELLLFTSDPVFAVQAQAAGVDGFIIDWESKGKGDRQRGHDMEINTDTVDDLRRVADAVTRPVIVRVNALGTHTKDEIAIALEAGASGLMLPMAEAPDEVQEFLDLVDARARVIIQIETEPLVRRCAELRDLAWDAAYIGLHDLMLSRGAASMWQAVLDGTVEQVFRTLADRRVGFAGATVIGGGQPIRFTQILHELARLGAGLTFLRRSFRREIMDRDMVHEIAAVRAAWAAGMARGPQAVESDRGALFAELSRIAAI